jgi:hypothetical protein
VNARAGQKIEVLVGGRPYQTEIDEHGVQRFIENPSHFLVQQIPKVWCKHMGGEIDDMNTMRIRYIDGEFNQRDYAEMHMAIGYSVSGFCELSPFEDMEVLNPIWA